MSVDQPDVIDVISFDPLAQETVLTISDHLDWSDTARHQELLQQKLNAYLAFVESGEILAKYPDAERGRISFRIVLKYRPDNEGSLFLKRAQEVVESAGFAWSINYLPRPTTTESSAKWSIRRMNAYSEVVPRNAVLSELATILPELQGFGRVAAGNVHWPAGKK